MPRVRMIVNFSQGQRARISGGTPRSEVACRGVTIPIIDPGPATDSSAPGEQQDPTALPRAGFQLINGAVRDGSGDRIVTAASPITGGDAVVLVPATASEVADAVEAAVNARTSWRRTAPAQRAAMLRQAAAAVRADAEHLGNLLCANTGRLIGPGR